MTDKRKATEHDRKEFELRIAEDQHWLAYFNVTPHKRLRDDEYADDELHLLWNGFCLGRGIAP